MAKSSTADGDIGSVQALFDDALRGMDATEAALAAHARGGDRLDAVNLPVEEAVAVETAQLLARWKGLTAAIVRALDGTTASVALRFERLFDQKAGRESQGITGHRLPAGAANPAGIAVDLRHLLETSATLDAVMKSAKPAISKHARASEDHLLRVIERRQRADFEIEDAQRRLDALAPRIADRRSRIGTARNATALATFEDDLRTLVADQETQRGREKTLLPERETLQRMIDIYETFVEMLNMQTAATNVIAAKLSLDIEQRIGLLRAVDVQVGAGSQPAIASSAVAELIKAYDDNVLAGHDIAARKAKADAAFARRLDPSPSPTAPDIATAASEDAAAAQP